MKPTFTRLVLPLSLLAGSLSAQEQSNPNRFILGARLSFNVSAKFDHIGGYPAATDAGPATGGGLNRDYDDGYVRVDSEGNAAGLTWNWGYRDAAQVPGDGNLYMHSSTAGASGGSRASADQPEPGFEIAWLRELGHISKATWGFKLGFSFVDLAIRDSAPALCSATRLTDTYSLSGIVPPGDQRLSGWQYQGVADLPGPVIDDTPVQRSTTTVPGGALTTGSRELSANVFGWQLGPWIELPVIKRLSFFAGAGVAWAVVDSTFRFQEMTTVNSVGHASHTGNGGDTSAIVGAYAEAGFTYAFTKRLGWYIAGEFQYLDSFSQTVSGERATLDLGQGWALKSGLNFSF